MPAGVDRCAPVDLDRLRPVERSIADIRALTRWARHRFVAGPEFAFEELKIGGGPPPLRVPEGGCSSTTASRA